jgi:nucleoid-associated protein YgaU
MGETLDRISARQYGVSTMWRLIAEANGINDPLALRPGAFLNIPKQQA